MTKLTDSDYEIVRRCAALGKRYTTHVEVELGELIDTDIEGFLDLISERAGIPLLEEIAWSLVDFKRPGDDTVILQVSGDVASFVDDVEANR